MLYIVRFLHQTTTFLFGVHFPVSCISSVSYIKPQLFTYFTMLFLVVYRPFPTSNHNYLFLLNIISMLYIVRFLHQTTTCIILLLFSHCCISSVSYIKPQLIIDTVLLCFCCISSVSYIKPQLSKMFNLGRKRCISSVSYIKPQPLWHRAFLQVRCISSVSYIKPQLRSTAGRKQGVVYRPFPTSNHNPFFIRPLGASVVYRPFPTSNHNFLSSIVFCI